MEILVQDLRYSMRPIARAPGFAPAVTAIGLKNQFIQEIP